MMKHQQSVIAAIVLSASFAVLAGCNDGSSTAAPSTAPSGTTAPAASVPAASAVVTPSPAASAAASSKPSAAVPAASPAADKKQLLHEVLELAKQGKAPGIEFAAHTDLIEDVEKAWGEPDKKESAGSGIYSTYSKRHSVIGFNKGSKIFDVRSSASNLQELKLSDIESALGKSADVRKNGDDTIYVYPAGKDFELKFIIPAATGLVSHISVFSPQDSKNNMAG